MPNENFIKFLTEEESEEYQIEIRLSAHHNDEVELKAYVEDLVEKINRKMQDAHDGLITQEEFEKWASEQVEFYIITKER